MAAIGDTYRSNIVSGDHGSRFQKDLYLIIFERLTIKGTNFKLAYEMMDAEKFDDVVVVLEGERNKTEEVWLFQAKHTDTSKGTPPPLTYEMLFPKKDHLKGDFSLLKYLASYSVIKRKFQGKMKVFIFTNRSLSSEVLNGYVKKYPQVVDETLYFSGEHVGLEVNDAIIEDMQNIINKEFIALRDAILKLFEHGIVTQAIIDYRTPLADVLEIFNSSVRFKPTFATGSNKPELDQLYQALKNAKIDTQTAKLIIDEKNNSNNQISKIFAEKSRNKIFPTFVDNDTVREFFKDLVLSVKQPDNLRPILSEDLEVWLKTWLRPENFCQLDKARLNVPVNEFDVIFDKVMAKTNERTYLKLADGRQCLEKIKSIRIFKQNEFCPFYINRQIGGITNILPNQLSDEDFARELTDKLDENNFFILSAQPGMGKSTILQYVAYRAQQIKNNLVYIIAVRDILQPLQDIKKLKGQNIFLSVFKRIFPDTHSEKIEKALGATNKRIIMFFDAFDEIAVEAREQVIEFFKQLQIVKNVKIVVDGRRHIQKLLENVFCVQAMWLVSFDRQNQINFLRKYWRVTEANEVVFQKYATRLLDLFDTKEYRALFQFTKLPLTLKMLAEIEKDGFEEYLSSNGSSRNSLLTQNIVGISDLYEKIIEHSFRAKVMKISTNWKYESKDYISSFKRFKLQHQLLAIELLRIPNKRKVFEDHFFKSEYDEFSKRIKDQTDKSTLIEIVDNNIYFVHLSYAEFFAAQFIYLNFDIFERFTYYRTSRSTEKNIFFSFPVIRNFYFALLEANKDVKQLGILKHQFQYKEIIRNWIYQVHGYNTINEMITGFDGKLNHALSLEILIEVVNFYEVFKFMIETYDDKLSIIYKGCPEETDFTVSVEYGSTEDVGFLIAKRATVNCTGCARETPLHLVLSDNHLEIVKLSIKHNASLNISDNLEQTTVYNEIYSITDCKSEIEYFIKELDGADKTEWMCPNNSKKLDISIKVLKLMFGKLGDIHVAYQRGATLLHLAVRENFFKAVTRLLNRCSVNINALDKYNRTPLHYAIFYDRIDMINLLFMKSASINVADKYGITPLHATIRKNFKYAFRLFLQSSANLNIQDIDKRTPLHLATFYNRIDMMKFLLENSANINVADKDGQTPLHIAGRKGFAKAFDLLLKHNASLEISNNLAQTPSHLAISYMQHLQSKIAFNSGDKTLEFDSSVDSDKTLNNDLNFLLKMLKMGIVKLDNIDFSNELGETLLHQAAREGVEKMVKLLLECSANVNAQDKSNQTPLHFATLTNRINIIEILLVKSAKVNATDTHGITPLHIAAREGFVESVDLLLEYNANLSAQDTDKRMPIHFAALKNRIDILKFLLPKSADVNVADKHGITSLHIAAREGFKESVELLFEYKAKLSAQDVDQRTPVHFSALKNRIDVLKFLLEKSADVNIVDKYGQTSLHLAAKAGFVKAVELILKYIRNVNVQDEDNRTPLYLATLKNRVDVLTFLLKKAADVNIADKNGVTPLHVAAQKGFIESFKILLGCNANLKLKSNSGETPVCLAILYIKQCGSNIAYYVDGKTMEHDSEASASHNKFINDLNFLLEMLKLKVFQLHDVNAVDKRGKTLLHHVAKLGFEASVKLLLDCSANLNAQDNKNRTPLYFATLKNRIGVLKLLINKSADVNIADRAGMTPLHTAAKEGREEAVELLLENNANINSQDEFKRIPLYYAQLGGHDRIVELLTKEQNQK